MIAAASPVATPKSAPAAAKVAPTATSIDVGIHVDEAITGKPAQLDKAWASATTSFAFDAPAGAELRVKMPEGVGFNAWAWGNDGRAGVSFAKQGAEWVGSAKVPLTQISLQTNAFPHRGDAIAIDGQHVKVADLAPSLTVAGVAQDSAKPDVKVVAPLGWQTAAADGTVDAQRVLKDVNDAVIADRSAALGAATIADFTAKHPSGGSTTGPLRIVREAAERVGDTAAGAAYTAMMLTGLAP